MLRHVCLAAGCLATLLAAQASAHFLWIDVPPTAAGTQQIEVYFSEEAAPGEAHLLKNIAAAKATVRYWEGGILVTQPVNVAAVGADAVCLASAGALPCGKIDSKARPVRAEATCVYGVFEHGPKPAFLVYRAQRLLGDWTGAGDLSTDGKALGIVAEGCQIAPKLANEQLRIDVYYEGQLAPKTEVVVADPAGKTHELSTDDKGRVVIENAPPGRYAVRAAHKQDKAGTHEGKPYDQIWHYTTLVLDVPGTTPSTASAPTATTNLSAGDLLKRARDARSMWHDFPGFTADVALTGDGTKVSGTVSIDAHGNVTLKVPSSPLTEWAEEQLRSMVQHRMPDGEISTGEVRYTDEDTSHPLGRKISLGESEMQSAYRIKDDAILEVNRSMGPQRFTISVLEIVRNKQQKYLPRTFTMNFYDSASGKLVTSLGFLNDWQTVGQFDLPKTILEIAARDGKSQTRQIEFANCKLLPPGVK